MDLVPSNTFQNSIPSQHRQPTQEPTNLPEFIPSEPNSKLHPMPTSSPNPVKEPPPPPPPKKPTSLTSSITPEHPTPSTRPRAPAPQVTPVETSSLSPFPPQPSITGFLPRTPPRSTPRHCMCKETVPIPTGVQEKKSWKDRPPSVMYETAFQTIIVPHISPNRSPGSPNLPPPSASIRLRSPIASSRQRRRPSDGTERIIPRATPRGSHMLPTMYLRRRIPSRQFVN